MYIRALDDLTEKRLAFGFEQALKLWKPEYGKTFPTPGEIREYADGYQPVDPIAETRKYLNRADKPPDWEELGKKSGVTSQDIAKWLEEGKQKQRAHIAELAKDPEWRKEAARASVPGYRETLEDERRAIPKDPEERKTWAHEKAVKQGLIPPDEEEF